MISLDEKNYSLNEILLSVIIPVYNVEVYIHKCLDSLVGQCDKRTEIICIDDGSDDASGQICEVYAKKFTNVSVFHKLNGGVSSARNVGLRNAKGMYIAWVDPDDYVTNDWFCTIKETLLKYEPDCLLYDYYYESLEGIKEVHANLPYKIDLKRFIYELSSEKHLQSGLPFKVIKKECFTQLSFDEQAIILEDYKLLTSMSFRFSKIIYISKCLYYNVRRASSLSNAPNIKKRLIAASIARERYLTFRKRGYLASKASYWKMALLVSLTNCNQRKIDCYDFYIQKKKYREMLKKDFWKIMRSKNVGVKIKVALCINIIFPSNFSEMLWDWIRRKRYY